MSVDPYLLAVEARDAGDADDRFAIEAFSSLATLSTCPCGTDHLLLTDGWRGIRLDMAGNSSAVPMLHYRVAGFASARRPAQTLRRLLALRKTGWIPQGRCLRPYSLSQRINELRVWDAMQAGATYREIARALFGNLVVPGEWRISAVRSRIRRLRCMAGMMHVGGWRRLFL